MRCSATTHSDRYVKFYSAFPRITTCFCARKLFQMKFMPGAAEYNGQRGSLPFRNYDKGLHTFRQRHQIWKKNGYFSHFEEHLHKVMSNLHFQMFDTEVVNWSKFTKKAITYHINKISLTCHQICKQVGIRHSLMPHNQTWANPA